MIGNNVLIVVDDSADADTVLREGLELCTKLAVQPTVLTVSPQAPTPSNLQQAIRQRIRAVSPSAANLDILTRDGDPAREIRKAAGSLKADLIVIGNHAESGLGLFLGSTANVVLHGTPCHVLAISLTPAG